MEKYNFDTIKKEKQLKLYVITLSDRASRGEYEDLSGKIIIDMLENDLKSKAWTFITEYLVIPDETDQFRHILFKAKADKADVIITTGSTGVGPRDIAPDVVKPMLDKEIPGIMELIRVKYGTEKPNAVLSRGIAGFMGQSQVYTLPGSSKAVKEYMTEILKTLEHLIFMYYGVDTHGK
jgi:molybdenum cofactor synthesis domain-containing protein